MSDKMESFLLTVMIIIHALCLMIAFSGAITQGFFALGSVSLLTFFGCWLFTHIALRVGKARRK